jgi:hypothetical protein
MLVINTHLIPMAKRFGTIRKWRLMGIVTPNEDDPILVVGTYQKSRRSANCPVRLPAFSAVCAAFKTPNVEGLLMFVAGGA